jgi:hypothetical protein
MPQEKVIRLIDFERRSREPDAAQPRNPADAEVIVLPVVRRFNAPAADDHRNLDTFYR